MDRNFQKLLSALRKKWREVTLGWNHDEMKLYIYCKQLYIYICIYILKEQFSPCSVGGGLLRRWDVSRIFV